jgi:hypothetical protein
MTVSCKKNLAGNSQVSRMSQQQNKGALGAQRQLIERKATATAADYSPVSSNHPPSGGTT